jgi:hypothetical protein
MTLTHEEVRDLLQRSLDRPLKTADRVELEAHLSECHACYVYAFNLDTLNRHLTEAMPQRWAEAAPRDPAAVQRFNNIEREIGRRRTRQRFLATAQPVLWTAGIGVVALLFIGVLSSMRNTGQDEPTSEPATGVPSEATSESTATVTGPCTAEIMAETQVLSEPVNGEPVATLEVGQTVPIVGVHYDEGYPWYEVLISLSDASPAGLQGWIPGGFASTSGNGCAALMPATGTPPADGSPVPDDEQIIADSGTPTVPWGTCSISLSASPNTDLNVYAIPGGSIIGQAEPGVWYLANGWFGGQPSYDTWARIDFNGTVGWVIGGEGSSWTCMPGADGLPFVDVNPKPATRTPTPTPEGNVCFVAPSDEEADRNVYALPDGIVIGSLAVAEWVQATGKYYPENAASWVQVDFFGQVGWVSAGRYMFDGRGTEGCWPLPDVDPGVVLPTFTPGATSEFPTPLPTSTLLPDMDYNNVIYVGGDPGSTADYHNALPNAQGGMTENIGVRVSVWPPGETRQVIIHVECTGQYLESFDWGYYGSSALNFSCGNTVTTTVTQPDNLIMLVMAVPPDGVPTIDYTITVTVDAAP